MNFNLPIQEYDLSGSVTEELIRLYGAACKLVLTDKLGIDLTFGDFSHFKADNKSCFEIYAMPENSEEFDTYEKLQTQFGVPIETSISFYVSKISAYNLLQPSNNSKNEYSVTEPDERIRKLISSLIITPSGKIFEITDIILDCLGLNNAFLYTHSKNVYKFKCKTYVYKNADELDINGVVEDPDLYEKQKGYNNNTINELENYFDRLSDITKKQNNETKDYYSNNDDVFGRF